MGGQCGKFVSHGRDILKISKYLLLNFEISAVQFPNFLVREGG